MERLKTLRNGLRAYFGGLKTDLIDKRFAEIEAELQRLGERISRFEGLVRDREGARDGLRQAIRDNGGDRITTLEREIDRKRSMPSLPMRATSKVASSPRVTRRRTSRTSYGSMRSLSATGAGSTTKWHPSSPP